MTMGTIKPLALPVTCYFTSGTLSINDVPGGMSHFLP